MGIKQLFFTSTVLQSLFKLYVIDRLSYIFKVVVHNEFLDLSRWQSWWIYSDRQQ